MLPESKIKAELIDKIRNTEDEELLAQISRLVDLERQIENVYLLSDDETRAINEGLDQLSKGEFLSNEEADTFIDKWLKR